MLFILFITQIKLIQVYLTNTLLYSVTYLLYFVFETRVYIWWYIIYMKYTINWKTSYTVVLACSFLHYYHFFLGGGANWNIITQISRYLKRINVHVPWKYWRTNKKKADWKNPNELIFIFYNFVIESRFSCAVCSATITHLQNRGSLPDRAFNFTFCSFP